MERARHKLLGHHYCKELSEGCHAIRKTCGPLPGDLAEAEAAAPTARVEGAVVTMVTTSLTSSADSIRKSGSNRSIVIDVD